MSQLWIPVINEPSLSKLMSTVATLSGYMPKKFGLNQRKI